jgi:hypothetical protein
MSEDKGDKVELLRTGMNRKSLWLLLSGGVLQATVVGSAGASEISARELEKLRQSPFSYMETLPTKYDADGRRIEQPASFFDPEQVANRDFVTKKDRARSMIMRRAAPPTDGRWGPHDFFSGINRYGDNPATLVDGANFPKTLEEIEAEKLTEAVLPEGPWSGDYWAIYKGNIAARYADPDFPASPDWKENYDYVQSKPMAAVISERQLAQIDLLSPGEKYELITGVSSGQLTDRLWAEGKFHYERSGKVETWFGICHGWAPAAYMLQRPQKVVEIPAYHHDFQVKFYPSDIKALASYLWAVSQPRVRFIGGRCNDKDPKKDENGRVLSQECFDNNPGAWHQAVVGQIGRAKRSIVLDATFDYEVWNQPVLSYKYTYFDPISLEPKASIAEALKPRAEVTTDRFAKYRDERTRYLIGVSMEVTYMVETAADQQPTNQPEDDRSVTVAYLYDLELDEAKNIIGGEWYNNYHPDFLWTPAKDELARTIPEYALQEAWAQGNKVPASWLNAAGTAARSGQVLGLVVEGLIRRAQ